MRRKKLCVKKGISAVVASAMVLTSVPAPVLAASVQEVDVLGEDFSQASDSEEVEILDPDAEKSGCVMEEAEEVTSASENEVEVEGEEAASDSVEEEQTGADAGQDVLLADFNFDNESAAGEFTGGSAKASGSYTLAEHDGGKALHLDGSNGQFLTVTSTDGSSLLTGKDCLTFSYDISSERTGANWAFYAAKDDTTPDYGKEWYVAGFHKDGILKAERYQAGRAVHNDNAVAVDAAVANHAWHHVDIVFAGDTTRIFVDGALTSTAYTVNAKARISNILGDNSVFYIGKANWGEYCKASIDNFQVYDGVKASLAEVILDQVKAELDLGNISAVDDNLELPTEFHGVPVSWTSSNEAVIAADGTVTCPEDANAGVTLTATLTCKGETRTKIFTATVLKSDAASMDTYLVASYNFDDGNLDSQKEGALPATAKIRNLTSDYTGAIAYDEKGRSGKAVRLGDYGLDLNQKNLGNDFTVSVWVKPDGTFDLNQCMLFLGSGAEGEERWTGVSGESSGTNTCKVWGQGGTLSTWTTFFSPEIGSDGWHCVTLTGKENTLTAYVDGVSLGTTSQSNNPLNGENQGVYIGVNKWDKIFNGLVDDVKVYKKSMPSAIVSSVYDQERVEEAAGRLDIGDVSAVKENLELPDSMDPEVAVTWTSSNEAVIGTDGTVTRPADQDKQVTLAATLTKGAVSVTKEFTVTVKKEDAQQDVSAVASALKMLSFTDHDLKLPSSGKYGTQITWSSSDTSVMSNDGKLVKRPAVGAGSKNITLTATISKGSESAAKTFDISIMEEAYGYIMGYVTGDNDRTGSLHLAYSQDGKDFTALNGNSGVLYAKNDTSNGNKNLSTGVRYTGAYLFRQADGKFGLVAPQGKDRKSVYLYTSEDLLTYTGEKLLSTNTSIGNVSDAECTYDTLIGAYRVNWTSGSKKYSNISEDLTKLGAAKEYAYTPSANEASTIPEGAKNYNVIPVTKAEYDKIIARFATVTNTGIETPKAVTVSSADEVSEALPKTLTASYSDGSQSSLNVTWDMDSIDMSKAGTYTVNGTITPYSNPLIEQRADPQIKYDEEEKCYYFTASYPAFNDIDHGYDRIVLRKADSIQELSDENGGKDKEITIWTAPASGKMAKHVWAPELHKINGKWYVFFAAGNSDDHWAIRPYVLVCQDHSDPYNAESWKKADDTYEIHAATSQDSAYFKNMSLDMTYFEHNGKHYVIWADIIGQSALYMQQIDPAQPWAGTGNVILLTTPEFGWERDTERVNEGPTILKHDGKIFCAFSASGTGPEYCIGMLYADENADLMDKNSWTKMNYPLLTSSDVPGEYGPGHNSFTVDAGGNPVFVYHARSEECYNNQCQWANANSLYDPCRHARVKNVHWTEDGLPILKMSAEEECPAAMRNVSVQVTVESDTGKKLSEVTVSEIEEMEATGEQLRPSLTVTYKGTELAENRDYVLDYGENKMAGKGTVTINPAAGSDYIGSKTVEFDIVNPAVEVVHYDMSRDGEKIKDASNNSHSAEVTDLKDTNFNSYKGVNTLTLKKDGYVSLPKGIVTDNTLTIHVTAATTQSNNQWLWAIGKDSWNYAFLTPSNTASKTKFAVAQHEKYDTSGAWASEKTILTDAKALDGKYQTYTLTIDDKKTVMYVNGKKVGEGENPYDITSFIDGLDVIGYIGKSLYSGDPLFVGQVADFVIYDDTLTAKQVQRIAGEADYKGYITADIYGKMLKDNTSADAIQTDLSFPAKVDGTEVAWNIPADQTVIFESGKVIRPTDGKDAKVAVTASYEWNGEQVRETFDLTVSAQNLNELADKLTLPYSTESGKEVYGNITLPKSIENVDITWETDHPEIVDLKEHVNTGVYADDPTPAGQVTRSAKDTVVTMTAILKSGNQTATKKFTFTVKAAPKEMKESDYTDYFFAYFVGQNAADQEQIYFSASQDGLNWEDLNNNRPYLTSTLGEKGVRDPFILRSHEGDKFYLIATDLSIYYNGDWGRAQTAGSNSLMVWESTDLVNWSEQRMIEVSADIGAGCTWAPEATYDEATGEYVVYWASKTPDDNYSKQRIWYAKTRDFYSFTESKVMIDNPDTTIDTTILKENGWYYRYSKNEKNKNIIAEKTKTLLHSDAISINAPVLGSQGGVEGPSIFKFNEDDVETNKAKYCLLLDNYGGGGYYPMLSSDLEGDFTRLTSGYKLPGGGKTPRHGTPMRITAAEYQKVMAAMAGTETPTPTVPDTTPTPAPTVPDTTPTPTPTVGGDVTLTPEAENQDGSLTVNVPEVDPGTKDDPTNVTVYVGKDKLPDQIKDSTDKDITVNVNVPDSVSGTENVNLESLILPKEVLKAAKDNHKNLIVKVNSVNGQFYQVSVNSADISSGKLANVNLLLLIDNAKKDNETKDKLYEDESGMTVDFAHRTDLPGTFSIKVDGKKMGFKEGDEVRVRYFTEDKKMADDTQTCVVDADGKITFKTEKGRKYILTKTTPIAVGAIKETKEKSTATKVTLTWKKVEGADGYRVYRYNSKTKKYERLAQVKTNSYVDTKRATATAQIYKIRAVVRGSKYYYGAYTSKIKVLTRPTKLKIEGKRTTQAGKSTTATISFKKVPRATAYRIYKYSKKEQKYLAAYQIKNGYLYKYNSKTQKFDKKNKVKVQNGKMICTLTGLNLKKEPVQKFTARSIVSKKGYKTRFSYTSNEVTIK